MGRCYNCGVGQGPLAQPSLEAWFWDAKTKFDRHKAWRRESKKRHRTHSGVSYLECRRPREADFAQYMAMLAEKYPWLNANARYRRARMCFQAPPRSKVRGLARRQAGIQREADPSLSEHA
eukprot:12103115-Prorocentrum_lima.AAC.1